VLGIIGSSSLGAPAGLDVTRRTDVRTPHGDPSAALALGALAGREVVFLARHGEANAIAPHEVNYRANIWALHSMGVRDVVALATVGGIGAGFAPGTLVIPDQIIDYTHGRPSTFGSGGGPTVHIDFTHPYCVAMRLSLVKAAAAAGVAIVGSATYAATQGPRLETAAEIDRLERDGADVVGMTAMPEAALAREIGLCYGAIAVVVNHAAGRGASEEGISLADAARVAQQAASRVFRILEKVAVLHGD
jgi:5'-methylthioadenosine phosphorylase